MKKREARSVVFLLSCILINGCGSPDRALEGESLAVLVEGTGTYSRPIATDSDLAQQFFDQGLRLTWGYHFPEAVASHQEALRHDANNPMIYWGLALANGPNPNSRYGRRPDDPQGEGRQAIEESLSLADNASAKDQALIEALYIRFDTETLESRDDRDQAYLEAMREVYREYPDDPDVVSLLADAFMVTTPWVYWDRDGRPVAGAEAVVSALEDVMELHPDHPGANHLYIHLIEAGPDPERALQQADRLEALMPGVGHVVHMPSHIYVRGGDYEVAIANNERSIEADQRFLESWGDVPFPDSSSLPLSAQNHSRHAHDFIRYAAGVQGNYATAIAASREAIRWESEAAIFNGGGQRTVATPWLVHKMFGQWDALLQEERTRTGRPYEYLDGMWLYATGSAYVGLGELDRARDALAELNELRQDPRLESVNSRFNPVSNVLRIASLGLEGEIREAEGDLDAAIGAFEEAVRLEDEMTYIEPPDWPQPMRHYLGAALLEAGRAEEAEAVYRRDLDWNQDNGWALFGLQKSLEAQGRSDEAALIEERFRNSWSDADVTLTRSRF